MDEDRPLTVDAPGALEVQLVGTIATDLAGYGREKLAAVLRHTGREPLYARLRVVRHPVRPQVDARAEVDLDGQVVHAHAEAATPREAVDLLMTRLARRLERVGRGWRTDRHGRYRPEARTVLRDAATPDAAAPVPVAGEPDQGATPGD